MSAHLKAQALRFVRVSVLAFAAGLLASDGQLSWPSLWALAAGAAEAGLRQAFPVRPVPSVTSVFAPPGDASAGSS